MGPSNRAGNRQDFWARQFADEITDGQVVYDAAMALVLPALCLAFDPIVFNATLRPALIPYAIVGRGTLCLAMAIFAYWLVTGRASAAIAGALAAAALLACGIGIVLLPFSAVGLMVGIGVLGLTPFATAFTFARNAVLAYRTTARGVSTIAPTLLAAAGFLGFLALPILAQSCLDWTARSAVANITSDDESEFAHGTAVLARLHSLGNEDVLVGAYLDGRHNEKRREQIARAYEAVNGRSIEEGLYEAGD